MAYWDVGHAEQRTGKVKHFILHKALYLHERYWMRFNLILAQWRQNESEREGEVNQTMRAINSL